MYVSAIAITCSTRNRLSLLRKAKIIREKKKTLKEEKL